MGFILAWLTTHITIDRLLKYGKKGYELVEARGKAIAAESEARQATRKERLNDVELRMHLLDGRVRKERGFSVRIVDPQIYVDELGVSPDLVQEVQMKQRQERILAHMQVPSRFRSRW